MFTDAAAAGAVIAVLASRARRLLTALLASGMVLSMNLSEVRAECSALGAGPGAGAGRLWAVSVRPALGSSGEDGADRPRSLHRGAIPGQPGHDQDSGAGRREAVPLLERNRCLRSTLRVG